MGLRLAMRDILCLHYDVGGAMVTRDEGYFPILNEELFGTPRSSKSQGTYIDILQRDH